MRRPEAVHLSIHVLGRSDALSASVVDGHIVLESDRPHLVAAHPAPRLGQPFGRRRVFEVRRSHQIQPIEQGLTRIPLIIDAVSSFAVFADSCWNVDHPAARLSLVPRLAALAGPRSPFDDEVFLVSQVPWSGPSLICRHGDRHRRGLDTTSLLGRRYPLEAVTAALSPQ